MTRQTATQIIERLGVELADTMDSSVDEIVDIIANTNYGDGKPTQPELDDLRTALETLRA